MVLKKSEKRILFLSLLLFLVFSCDDIPWLTYCPDCFPVEPETTLLDFRLDYSNGPIITEVKIYEGNIEDSIIYKTFSTSGTTRQLEVSLNKKYAVTARYYQNGTYYIAFDSATPRVRYDKETCEEPCYYVYDRVINLKLK